MKQIFRKGCSLFLAVALLLTSLTMPVMADAAAVSSQQGCAAEETAASADADSGDGGADADSGSIGSGNEGADADSGSVGSGDEGADADSGSAGSGNEGADADSGSTGSGDEGADADSGSAGSGNEGADADSGSTGSGDEGADADSGSAGSGDEGADADSGSAGSGNEGADADSGSAGSGNEGADADSGSAGSGNEGADADSGSTGTKDEEATENENEKIEAGALLLTPPMVMGVNESLFSEGEEGTVIDGSEESMTIDETNGLWGLATGVSGVLQIPSEELRSKKLTMTLRGAQGASYDGLTLNYLGNEESSGINLTLENLTIQSPAAGYDSALCFDNALSKSTSNANTLTVESACSMAASGQAASVIENKNDTLKGLNIGGTASLRLYATNGAAGISGRFQLETGEVHNIEIYADENSAHLSAPKPTDGGDYAPLYFDTSFVLANIAANNKYYSISIDGKSKQYYTYANNGIRYLNTSGEEVYPVVRFWLTKGTHTVKIGSSTVTYSWNDGLQKFEVASGLYTLTGQSIEIDKQTSQPINSEHGTILLSKAQAAAKVTITVTPQLLDSDYEITGLTVKNGDTTVSTTKKANGTYTFTMPAGDVTVTATFQERKNILLFSMGTENGSYEISAVDARGKERQQDESWKYDVDECPLIVKQGDTITVQGTPEKGYGIKSVELCAWINPYWSKSKIREIFCNKDNYCTFEITADDMSALTKLGTRWNCEDPSFVLKVSFSAVHGITYNAEHCTVEGPANVCAGNQVELQLQAEGISENDVDYYRVCVSYRNEQEEDVKLLDSDVKGQTCSFPMPDADVTVTVSCVGKTNHTLSLITEHGSAELSVCSADGTARAGLDQVKYGDTVTVTAAPEEGYSLREIRWSYTDGEETLQEQSLTLTELTGSFTMVDFDVTVTVVFEKKYQITYGEVQGEYKVSGNVTEAFAGDAVTVSANILAVSALDIASVSVKVQYGDTVESMDAEKQTNGSYRCQFTMPAADVTLSAAYRERPDYRVTITGTEELCAVKLTGCLAEDKYIRLERTSSEAFKAGDIVAIKAASEEPADWSASKFTPLSVKEGYFLKAIRYSYTDKEGQLCEGTVSYFSLKKFLRKTSYGNEYDTIDFYGFTMPEADVTLTLDIVESHSLVRSSACTKGVSSSFFFPTNYMLRKVSGSDSEKYLAAEGEKVKVGILAERLLKENIRSFQVLYAGTDNLYAEIGNGVDFSENGTYYFYTFTMPDADVEIEYICAVHSIYGTDETIKKGVGEGVSYSYSFELDVDFILDEVLLKDSEGNVYKRLQPSDGTVETVYYTSKIVNKYTFAFEMPDYDLYVEPVQTERPDYTLMVDTGSGGGTVMVTSVRKYSNSSSSRESKSLAKEGDYVSLRKQADAGYQLVSAELVDADTGEVVSTLGTATEFRMPARNLIIRFRFGGKVTVTPDTETENGTVSVPSQQAAGGASVEVTLNPDDGYGPSHVWYTLNGEKTEIVVNKDGKYVFICPSENVVVSAEFGLLHTLTAGTAEGGRVTLSEEKAAAGRMVYVTQEVRNGNYTLKSLKYSYKDSESQEEITVELTADEEGVFSFVMPDSDITVTAEYECHAPDDTEYQLTAVSDTGTKESAGVHYPGAYRGAVTPTVSAASAVKGTEITVTVTTPEGYYTGYGAVKYTYEEYGQKVTKYATPTDGARSAYGQTESTYTFIMPDADVEVSARTTSADVWDGVTIDVSWYDPDEDSYVIERPAQLMGLAAIVNGIYNDEIDTVIGDNPEKSYIHANTGVSEQDSDSSNMVGSDIYYYGDDSFLGKTVVLDADLDMGGSDTRYMPIGGQYLMNYTDYPSYTGNSDSHLSASFCGVFDGQGHSISNVCCDRYVEGENYGDSQSIGLFGRVGVHGNDASYLRPVNPTIRNLILKSGNISGRRSVGGIVGKVDKTDTDGIGGIVENCINYASVSATDKKGTGGIVGAFQNSGLMLHCANFGTVTNELPGGTPTGGLIGMNEVDIIGSYNVGQVEADKDSYAMAIGTRNAELNSLKNVYYLEGSAPGGGYYNSGSSEALATPLSSSEMRSEDFAEQLNSAGEIWRYGSGNNGYPVLFYQVEEIKDCLVIINQQISGGSITAETIYGGFLQLSSVDTVKSGTTLRLSYNSDSSMELEYYTLNGQKVDGCYVFITEDSELSAVFRTKKTIPLYLPEDSELYTLAIMRQSTVSDGFGGRMKTDDKYTYTESDIQTDETGRYISVNETDYIYFKVTLKETADSPENVNKRYNGNFYAKVSAYSGNDDTEGSKFTLTGKSGNYAEASFKVTADYTKAVLSIVLNTADKTWIDEGCYDSTWYDKKAPQSAYTISTPQQLAGVAYLVKNEITDFSGVTLTLDGDISLENPDGTDGIRYWVPIGPYASRAFSGTFDGGGHTIFLCQISGTLQGVFGSVSGTIQNLTVDMINGITLKVKNTMGAVAGELNETGVITGCVNRAVLDTNSYAGGIVGVMHGGTVTECTNEGSVTGGTNGTGGIVGKMDAGVYGKITSGLVKNCQNNGTVMAGVSSNGNTSILGGIVGILQAGSVESCKNNMDVSAAGNSVGGILGKQTGGTCSDCENHGNVSGGDYVGGISGGGSTASGTVIGGKNYGTVKGNDYVGGCFGGAPAGSGSSLDGCANAGTVQGANRVGGVAGYASRSTNGCTNSGQIIATGDEVGGIAGYRNGSSELSNCENSGTVKSDGNSVGGVVGYYHVSGQLRGCKNSGSVSGKENVGGIIGIMEAPSARYASTSSPVISGNSNAGSVSGSVYTGGLIGRVNLAQFFYNAITLSGCQNAASGTVSGGDYTGGLVGAINLNDYSLSKGVTLTSSDNFGNVRGNDYTGGLIGLISGMAKNIIGSDSYTCRNTGTVTGTSYVGGLIGELSSGTFTRCINDKTGSVSGDSYVGGVVGALKGSGSCSLTECGNEGDVTCSGNYGGGVAGYVTGVLELCRSKSGTVSVHGSHSGGVAGYVDGDLRSCYSNHPGLAYLAGTVTGTVYDCYTSGSSLTANGKTSNSFAGVVEDMVDDLMAKLPSDDFIKDFMKTNSGLPVLSWEGDAFLQIDFYNYSGSELLYQSAVVTKGTVITYNGPTPEPPADSRHEYAFLGWVKDYGSNELVDLSAGDYSGKLLAKFIVVKDLPIPDDDWVPDTGLGVDSGQGTEPGQGMEPGDNKGDGDDGDNGGGSEVGGIDGPSDGDHSAQNSSSDDNPSHNMQTGTTEGSKNDVSESNSENADAALQGTDVTEEGSSDVTETNQPGSAKAGLAKKFFAMASKMMEQSSSQSQSSEQPSAAKQSSFWTYLLEALSVCLVLLGAFVRYIGYRRERRNY